MEKRYRLHIAMLSAVHFRMRHSTVHKHHAIVLKHLAPLLNNRKRLPSSINSSIRHDKTSHSSFFLLQNHNIVGL